MQWFTADPHFGHKNIIKYCQRPFRSVREMDEAIIERWNSVVSAEDTVWILGDYAMASPEPYLQYLHRMHGEKILVSGNHDKCSPVYRRGYARQRDYLFDEGGNRLFSAVVEYAQVSLSSQYPQRDNIVALVSHYPYAGDSWGEEDRYQQFRLPDHRYPLVHGHVHTMWRQKFSVQGTPMVNVGVDVQDFTPVSEYDLHRVFSQMSR